MISANNDESSSTRPLLGIGKPLCVICGVRPAFNSGRRSYPTCGLTCAGRLQSLMRAEENPTEGQDENLSMCIICGLRPQFNNGRRAFPTCGNTCARRLQDMTVIPSSILGQISGKASTKMCSVCNLRPRCERAGKVYPTCGLTCAAKLHARDRQAVEAPREIIPNNADDNAGVEVHRPAEGSDISPGFLIPTKTTILDAASLEPFECIICLETLERHHLARIACDHTFCRTCLKNHITSELGEHHYPIICPSCKIGKARSDKPVSTVDDVMIQTLGLGEAELAVFYELQLSAHSITIHCQRCKETIFVDRSDYQHTKIIECPLPRCNYLWCKLCQREVIHGGPRHSCDGSKELEHLMKENGWRHCPGCLTPVQKSEGCNHMTCSAPGCNTHFCYRCGGNIIKSLLSADIRAATKQHYEGCQLF